MVSELKGPSEVQINKFIITKCLVEFKLINGESVCGKLMWVDNDAFLIEREDNSKITLLRSSILYYYSKD